MRDKRDVAETLDATVDDVLVADDDDGDAGLGEHDKRSRVAVNRSAMTDGAVRAEGADDKAQAESGRFLGELWFPHGGEGFRLEQAATAREQGGREAAEILHGGEQIAGGDGAEVEDGRLDPAPSAAAVGRVACAT